MHADLLSTSRFVPKLTLPQRLNIVLITALLFIKAALRCSLIEKVSEVRVEDEVSQGVGTTKALLSD